MAKRKKDLLAILSDKPTKDDLLNFRDYSNLLTNVILNSETPATIGVFGDWGSGKTSLMLMIDENLQKKKLKTIWFNAWKYDKEDALWRSLILSIIKGLSSKEKDIDGATLKLYSAVSTEKLGQIEIDWLEIGKTLLKGAAFLAAPLLLIPGFANIFANSSFVEQIPAAFTRRKIQQSRERISSIEEFEDLYKELISKHIDGEKIVVFIDDLDRCLPTRALEVFEALKSFLDADGCVYVVACDTRLINQGLHEKYTEKSKIDLEDYLGKIVQFSFSIPPIRAEDAENFIRKLGLAVDSDDSLRLISTSLERNPRKLKRFLSDLKIKSQLVKSRGLLLKTETLIKMSCIAFTWKDFWIASLSSPSVFSRAQKIAISPAEEEKSPDDIEFGKLFHLDDRLYSFLSSQPLVSDADLLEYIFLSTTTSTSLPEPPKNEKIKSSPAYESKIEQVLFDFPVDQRINERQRNELNRIVAAIRGGTSLIVVTGRAGVGKTTLLRLVERVGSENNNYISTYVRIESFAGLLPEANVWFYEIARRISQDLSDKGFSIRFKPSKDQITLHEFERFIADALGAMKDKRFVIMLDGYDALPSDLTNRFDYEFLPGLRTILTSNSSVTLILSGRYRGEAFPENFVSQFSDIESMSIELSGANLGNIDEEYERLMSLPTNDYDLGEAYKLLFLFENELRRLITTQFDKFDWWKIGLSKLPFKRISNISDNDRLASLTLGELFKIMLANESWERIFNEIFPNKDYIEEKTSIILNTRNQIAHTRELSYRQLEQFVISAKDMLKILHTKNSGLQ